MSRHIFYLLLIICLFNPAVFAQEDDNEARVTALYTQAESAYEHGELDKAITLYKETIKLAPEIFQPKFQCAMACLATKKPELLEEAIALLKDVTKLQPDFARGYAALGDALSRNNELNDAEEAIKHALALDEKLPVRALLADLLMARGAYKEAEVELKLVVAQGKPDWQHYFALALAEERSNQLESALGNYQRALELHPKDADIYYRRGLVYAQQQNFAAAVTELKAAYQINTDEEIGFALAENYAAAGDKKAATELAEMLVTKASPELRAACTELLARLGANANAIAQFEKLLAAEPKNVKYLTRLGELYLDVAPDRAVNYWQQAIELAPTAENQVGFGSALLKAQRFEEAAHHFNAALAQNANYYEAHAGLGLAFFKLERFDQAVEQFVFTTRARPDYAINCFFLAICFDRLGDLERALAGYELFLKLANAKRNQLEIDKVRLRLPSLRRQLEKHPGKKKR